MNILTAKKLPEMVLKQSFMRDIHFESVFNTKYVNTKKVGDDLISEPNFVYAKTHRIHSKNQQLVDEYLCPSNLDSWQDRVHNHL